jgi:hypothetical protein
VLSIACIISSASAGDKSWFGFRGVKGSGELASEAREVEDFTRIKSTGSFDVYVAVGKKTSLTIEFDDNLLELIETRVRGNTLVLDAEESFRSRHNCRVEITVPSLERVTISGSGDIEISNLTGEYFECWISGSGNIKAQGRVQEVEAKVSGSGEIDLGEVKAIKAYATISGSGDIRVYASAKFDGSVSGSGDIFYYGDPLQTDRHVSGSGKIKRMR